MKNHHRASGKVFHEDKLLFPGKITRGEGAVSEINAGPYRAPFLFSDSYVMREYAKPVFSNNPDLKQIIFSGQVWPGESYRVKRILAEAGADCLIAMGGGKVMDLAKLMKKEMPAMKLIAVPTSAATCAAMTPVAVMYDKDGAYADTLDTPVPDEVVMDYEIFYKLPMPFFAAGAADAMAKYYETSAAQKKHRTKNGRAVLKAALACKEMLKELIFLKWENPDNDVKRQLAELNIITSGMISCGGRFEITGLMAHCAAHAMTHIPSCREYLHGEHAAAGLILQEGILNNKKNISELQVIFSIIDAPLNLASVGMKKSDLKAFFEAYEKISQREKIYLYSPKKLLYNNLEAYL